MRYCILLISILLFYCSLYAQFVDEATPSNVKPAFLLVSDSCELVFSDEFNGTEVNTTKWNVDNSTKSRAARKKIGITDWRWKPENVSVKDGNLVLEVHKTGSNSMTNGSVNTYTKYHTQYGYFEARIKVGDASKGTHTAFWLQGPNMGNVDGTANDGAEIDIFESAWTDEYTKSVVHIDGYGKDHKANTKKYDTPEIHDGFHTWGLHWTEYFMDIYYDGVRKVRYTDPKWVVKSPEFLWLSNGASFGVEGDQYFLDYPIGYLTETYVDYIRVWKTDENSSANDSILNNENWSLIKVDSEDVFGGNVATNAFDGNPYTFWHTEWNENQPVYPHEIQIDLGDTAMVSGFEYTPRQDNNTNGNIDEYAFYASNNSKYLGDPIKTGAFGTIGSTVYVALDVPVNCKYIKLVALSEVNGLNFANVAELSLVGMYIKDSEVGVSQLGNGTIVKAYPNPFSEEIYLTVEDSPNIIEWRLFTADGILILEGQNYGGKNQLAINTQYLPMGLYLLEIINGADRERKLMVKK